VDQFSEKTIYWLIIENYMSEIDLKFKCIYFCI